MTVISGHDKPQPPGCLLDQHERNTGSSDGGLTTAVRQRLNALERENRELRRSNDILRQASAYFAKAEFDRLWKK
ncbi:transposase [Escherichia coli]|nr:transposase [Escherichia coli]